jgi:hypothetical protein
MTEIINQIINFIVYYSNITLMPLMFVAFFIGVLLRGLIYFTVRCEYMFSLEMEKRVHKHLAHEDQIDRITSFHQLTKKILENTYFEVFELKRKYRRRRFDHITSVTDRVFLIQEGVARLIKDTLSQTKYLRKGGRVPKFLDISKFVFGANPVFNKVLGIFPMGVFNDILNILPGLFVIGGIFGTFVGVMQALPALGQMDISDVAATKSTMDAFLLNMAFSMGTSIVGIVLSVVMTIINALMAPEGIFVNMVNKYTSSLEFLWNDTLNNELGNTDKGVPADRRIVAFANTMQKPKPNLQDLFLEPSASLERELRESPPVDRGIEEEEVSELINLMQQKVEQASRPKAQPQAGAKSQQTQLQAFEARLRFLQNELNQILSQSQDGSIAEENMEKYGRIIQEVSLVQQSIARLRGGSGREAA